MTTRIVAGQFKRSVLSVPDGKGTRPTLARLKESLFGFLGRGIEGMRVCDLFAGSGSLGLEALSRGASSAIFVEKSSAALRCLVENIANLGLREKIRIVEEDVFDFLERCKSDHIVFDIVFADPDYRSGDAVELLQFLDCEPAITGILCLEHNRRESLPEEMQHGELVRELTAGNKIISVFFFGGAK
jgi:16S rRNA (guanine(966)-N(2))-methyltransferase RsmD